MTWQFASALNIGDRNEQQDRVTILHSENAHLLVVADGMGGHIDGAAAAQTVIDIATRRFTQEAYEKPGLFLAMTCLEAHKAISAQSKGSASAAPGSTCVMLYLVGNGAFCVHVGDSRMYQFRDNKLLFKTTDHSVSELLKKHRKTAEDVLEDQSTQNQLYMCLGGKNDVIPELSAMEVRSGDLLLLCSDGFWSQLSEQEMLANMDDGDWGRGKAEQLVHLAKQRGQGQSDNVSLAWAYWQGATDNKGSGVLKWLTFR
jgi:serine/threonine protein phosphatase PrpC